MKVYEIIAEAELTAFGTAGQNVATGRDAYQADVAKADAERQAAARAQRVANRDALQAKKNAPITAKSRELGKAYTQTVTSAKKRFTTNPLTKESLRQFLDNIRAGKDTIGGVKIDSLGIKSKAAAQVVKQIGSATYLLKLVGFMDMAHSYWQDKTIIEEASAAGELTDEQYQNSMRLLHEELVGKIIASAMLAKFLRYLLKGITSVRFLKNLFGGLLAPITAGVSVAAIVASEVAFIWFQRWLESPDGREAASWFVAHIIDASIPSKGIEMLNSAFKQAESKAKTPTPGQTAEPAAEPGAPEGEPTPDPGVTKFLKSVGLR